MVIERPNGTLLFRVYRPHAASVDVIGDFTDWTRSPRPMTADEDGWWTAIFALPAGDHDFAYLIDESQWLPDFAATGVRRDPDGRWVSVLSVPAPASAEAAARGDQHAATA